MKILDLKIINDKIELEIEDKKRMEIFSIFTSIEEFQNLILKFWTIQKINMPNYKNNKAWRKRNPATWQACKQRYYKQFEAGAYNSRQKYTTQEDDMIINKKYIDRVIAKKISRSVKAIQIRRVRLNVKI